MNDIQHYPIPIREGQFYFSVCSEGIVNLTRQMYHFENKKQEAIDMLSSYDGITDVQINAIINGNGTLKTVEGGAKFVLESDSKFKFKLKKHQEYIESKFVTLAGKRIPKEIIEPYAKQIVKRLRDTMKEGLRRDRSPEEILHIMSLEEQRQELHKEILKHAGFNGREQTDEYNEFANALDKYLDEYAGSVVFKKKTEVL